MDKDKNTEDFNEEIENLKKQNEGLKEDNKLLKTEIKDLKNSSKKSPKMEPVKNLTPKEKGYTQVSDIKKFADQAEKNSPKQKKSNK